MTAVPSSMDMPPCSKAEDNIEAYDGGRNAADGDAAPFQDSVNKRPEQNAPAVRLKDIVL